MNTDYLRPALILVGAFAAVWLIGCTVGGLEADRWVKVQKPAELRSPMEPKVLSLREARRDIQNEALALDQYATDIGRADEIADQLDSVVSFLGQTALDAGSASLSGAGLTAFTLLGGLAFGWLGIRKPGTLTRDEAERMAEDWRQQAINETLAAKVGG